MTDDLEIQFDPAELLDFETPVDERPIKPLTWSYEKYVCAQALALSGKTKKAISEETKIPLHVIRRWEQHPEFQDYIKEIVLKSRDELLAANLSLLQKAINAKRDKIEEEGGDYSKLSNRDIASLIETVNELVKEKDSKEDSGWMKQMKELIEQSAKIKTIDITPESGGE